MKFIIALLFVTVSSTSQAQSITDGWKWGVGFDSVANIKSSVSFEIATPKLFGELSEYSLVLGVSSQTLNYSLLSDNLGIIPVRLMFEARNTTYKEVISGYVRIGAGYSFASDEFIHKNDGYFIIPFAVGADLFQYDRENIHGSIFAQASFDMNFVEAEDGLANDLDGTAVSVGARVFY